MSDYMLFVEFLPFIKSIFGKLASMLMTEDSTTTNDKYVCRILSCFAFSLISFLVSQYRNANRNGYLSKQVHPDWRLFLSFCFFLRFCTSSHWLSTSSDIWFLFLIELNMKFKFKIRTTLATTKIADSIAMAMSATVPESVSGCGDDCSVFDWLFPVTLISTGNWMTTWLKRRHRHRYRSNDGERKKGQKTEEKKTRLIYILFKLLFHK